MSPRLVLCLIMVLQLVGGIASSEGNVSSAISTEDLSTASTEPPGTSGETTLLKSEKMTVSQRNEQTQDHQGKCTWWCSELFGIIVLAAAGAILISAIILCAVSCCLWRRIKYSKKKDLKDREMDMLGPKAPTDTAILPIPDVGPSDTENCTVSSELSKKETPQETEDQPADEAPMFYPPPEDIPMLP